MKNQKRKSRTINFSTEPFLALFPVIGRTRRRYQSKKVLTYTFAFLWFVMEVGITKYKMVRAIDVKPSDL